MAQKFRRLFREDKGSQLVEFALVVPLLVTIVMGIITFGQAFGTYQTLTNAAAAGAQALSIARGQTTNPCTTVSSPVFGVAPTLTQNSIKFTISITPPSGVTGTNYTLATNMANPTCAAASTTSAPASDLQQSWNANVTITYPCYLYIYGVNFAPNCTLTAQTSEAIQ
jgi:Flp pilus assembly protein TadG